MTLPHFNRVRNAATGYNPVAANLLSGGFNMNDNKKNSISQQKTERPSNSLGITQSSGLDRHAIFNRQGFSTYKGSNLAGAECARQYKGNSDLISSYQEVVGALCAGDEKGPGSQYVGQDKCVVETQNLIRRLTPLECERLQGFPDRWTDISGSADSARYRALGNSVAIPCVDHVLHGIATALRDMYN